MAENEAPTAFPLITSPDQLDAFLMVLKDNGVEEFSGFGIHVRFIVDEVEEEEVQQTKPQVAEVRNEKAPVEDNNVWRNPALWPGGMPPKFPGDNK